MPSIVPSSPSLSSEAALAQAVGVVVERWRTIARSETSEGNGLRPARDPADAEPWRRGLWAGTCRSCRTPIWAPSSPGKGPKYCPDHGGPAVVRPWSPPGGGFYDGPPWTMDPGGSPLADPHKQRRSEGGFYDARTRPSRPRGGRPRIHVSDRVARAAAARAYRARRRERG